MKNNYKNFKLITIEEKNFLQFEDCDGDTIQLELPLLDCFLDDIKNNTIIFNLSNAINIDSSKITCIYRKMEAYGDQLIYIYNNCLYYDFESIGD